VAIWRTGDPAAIVSDVHLGSAFCHSDAFVSWLKSLPPDVALALNGDILDNVRHELPASHSTALSQLIRASFERPVVWILGNHDDDLAWDDVGQIIIARHLEIGTSLLVTHGDYFDDIMPRSRILIRLFERLHMLRLRLGAPHVHVAQYAKRWRAFYRLLNDNIRKNAATSAQRNGFEAVACGHTHCTMDVTCNGIRYLNTGAWTEEPLHYLQLQDGKISLRLFPSQTGSCP
jgi:UDP-2,3-diacylglucosamine pyrophosphatase LpxH